MIELAQQLAVIMIGIEVMGDNQADTDNCAGKQCINNCQEMFIPMFKTWLHRKKVKSNKIYKNHTKSNSLVQSAKHWCFSDGRGLQAGWE